MNRSLLLAVTVLLGLSASLRAAEPKKLLVISATAGARHASIPNGEKMLREVAAKSNGQFTLVMLSDAPDYPFSRLPGGGRGGRGRYRPLAEINVTPLVDVMLVLLIIFMVTAPLMTSGVTVDLPKTNAAPLNNDNQPLTVSIDAKGKIYLQDEEVAIEGVAEKLKAVAQNNEIGRAHV